MILKYYVLLLLLKKIPDGMWQRMLLHLLLHKAKHMNNLKEALELYYEDEPMVESKPAMFTTLEVIA